MSSDAEIFRQFRRVLADGGVAAVLERLAEQLRVQKRYPELFEARKMQVRHGLGLPADLADSEELDEDLGRRLEEGVLAACREVGMALLLEGRVREGWLYMRAVGDRAAVAQALAGIPVNQENVEAIIEVALHEGVDADRGFRLVLEHFGTCHAITVLQSAGHQLNRADQRVAAGLLLRHLHRELLDNLRADIARRQPVPAQEPTLRELIAERDWLFGEFSTHIDAMHLAATVRAARILDDEESLRRAADLAAYGRCLSRNFQFPGEEPFADFYPNHELFFRGSQGEEVDAALEYFRGKAETVDAGQHGTLAVEVYVELLSRLGRDHEAIEAGIAMFPEGAQWLGFAPTLMELSRRAGSYERVLDYCQRRGDLLGFVSALLQAPACLLTQRAP